MIEDYFNNNGVGVPATSSYNGYYVGFALAAALILWLKRRNENDDDDAFFIKQNKKNTWGDFIRDPLNRRRKDNDDNDFDEII
jgi:hypothetical protein